MTKQELIEAAAKLGACKRGLTVAMTIGMKEIIRRYDEWIAEHLWHLLDPEQRRLFVEVAPATALRTRVPMSEALLWECIKRCPRLGLEHYWQAMPKQLLAEAAEKYPLTTMWLAKQDHEFWEALPSSVQDFLVSQFPYWSLEVVGSRMTPDQIRQVADLVGIENIPRHLRPKVNNRPPAIS